MEAPHPHSSFVRNFYFWVGVVSTVLYRIIIVLNNYSSTLVLAAWYLGTIGFIIYFSHRYQISELRAKLIKDNKLIEKVNDNPQLAQGDKDSLNYILRTLTSSREKTNFIIIFVLSVASLLWGLYLDFFSKIFN